MAIQKAIVDAPAVTRSQVQTVIGLITDVAPPGTVVRNVDGVLLMRQLTPDREGQMVFVQAADGLSVMLYIVVLIAGTQLQWRRVFSTGVITDPRTGQPKDPLYDLY